MHSLAKALIRWEWLLLLLLLLLVTYPTRLNVLALLFLPLLWGARRLASGRFFPATPFDLSILLLLVMILASYVVTFDAALSVPKIAGIVLGVGLFYGTVYYARSQPRGLWPVLAFVLLAGSGMALVGLVAMRWEAPFGFLNRVGDLLPGAAVRLPGAVGGVVNANELAGTLDWIAPLMLACLIGMWRRLWRTNRPLLALLLAGSVVTSFFLLATLSRGGILAFALGLSLVMALYVQPRWRLVLAVGLVVAALVLFFSYNNPQVEGDLVGDTLGLQGRLEIWSRAALAIGDFPLTGVSVNGFRRVIHELYPVYVISSDIDLAHAHNHLLQAALDVGLPGLAAYVSLWVISAYLLWQTGRRLIARQATDHPYYALVVGLSGSLVAGWVFGLFDAVALGARPAFIWWLLLGLVASVQYAVVYSGERLHRRRRRSAATPEAVRDSAPVSADPAAPALLQSTESPA